MEHFLSYGQPPLPLNGILDEFPYLGQYVLKHYRSLGLTYLSWRFLLPQYEADLRLFLSRLLPHDEAYIWKLLLGYVQALGLALSRLLPLCKDFTGNFKPNYMVESKLNSIINGLKYYKILILHVSIGGLGFGLCMYSFMERFVLSKLFFVEWKELKPGKFHYQVSFGLLVGHLTPGVNDMSLLVNRLVFSAFDAVFGTLQDALDFDIGWCFIDATRKPVALFQFAETHTFKVALIATTILGVRAFLSFPNSKPLVMPLVSNGVCNELKPLLHDLRCLSTVFTSILYAFIFWLAIVLANALVLYGLVLNTSSIFGV